jgi:HlyD family secretion protein
MKKKSFIALAVIALVALGGLLIAKRGFSTTATTYRFATISSGDIQSKVSATGTLNAVTTVSVGTQVSGQVSDLLVDYNAHVTKGELLARIDPTLAQQSVADADANLQKAVAQEGQSQRDFNRNQQLMVDGLIPRSDYELTQSGLDVARATVRSAQVALDRAKQNLAYTNIYAPIDGVVVDRNVQKGQTVAASLSAPQLFLIANDLAHMQILAQVGESDIAQIKPGQTVNFTVQALPNQTFHGTVQQVRLQSTTTDNVVNYTVVIAVDNAQGKLLPGMTARVDFITKAATNVLKVSNAALRFRPTGVAVTKTRSSSLYYLDAKGAVASMNVRAGITDGSNTEVSGQDLKVGMKVITGTVQPATASTQTTTSATPFNSGSQPQQGGGRRGGV